MDDGREDRIEAIGAPSDPLRPTGRVNAQQATADAKARMAGRARKVLRVLGIVLAATVLVALLFFLVVSLLPKPDL